MEINDLMMLTDEHIYYSSLSLDTLKELALSNELFIANSALGELSERNSSIAASIAWEILLNLHGDCYLQAAALEIIFEFDQEKALDYISREAYFYNTYILNFTIQLMIENEFKFKSKNALPSVCTVLQRLKEIDSTTQYPDPQVRDNFLNTYSHISDIEVADAVTQ